MTSDGAHIKNWGKEIGIEFDIPPGTVPNGRLDIRFPKGKSRLKTLETLLPLNPQKTMVKFH